MKNIYVRNTSQTPIYQQLFDQISTQIIMGELSPDDSLPSIRTFAKEIGVSIITIKKTWELLERNDYIYTIKGKGSYVKKNTQNQLNKKRLETAKELLSESITLCKSYGVSIEELKELIEKLYNKQ